MMSMFDAKKIFSKKYPDLVITRIVDWDPNHYVLIAVPDTGEEYMDPFYSVDKRSSKVYSFSPGEDFEKFSELIGG